MIYNYVEVGTWRKPFGTGGHIRLQAKDVFADQIAEAEVLFAMHHGTYVPYFVTSVNTESGLIVKVEGIDSPESCSELSGLTCYMREQDLVMEDHVTDEEYHQLVGLKVLDGHLRGEVKAILDYPQQKMMQVLTVDQKEVLIPIAPALIVDITEQHVEVQLPSGYWEIFS